MRRLATPIALAAVVLVARCGSDDSAGPMRPVEATPLVESPAFTQSLSPDGRWVAAVGERGEVCLRPTNGEGEPVCAGTPGRSTPSSTGRRIRAPW
ncbi:MAG: hypothetical protein AAFZ07_04810 [Actinomycetota bacterium]